MNNYTVHQPMLFIPIYLLARFARAKKLVWLDLDHCKDGNDGWHTKCKLVGNKSNATIHRMGLVDRSNALIKDAQIYQLDRWWVTFRKALEQHYRHAPNYVQVGSMLGSAVSGCDGRFCALNVQFIEEVFKYLGLDTEFYLSSSLGVLKDITASKWLCDLGIAINSTTYLCASNATEKYLDAQCFKDYGIALETQEYIMPQYRLGASPTTSLIDLLMWKSPYEVMTVLHGVRP